MTKKYMFLKKFISLIFLTVFIFSTFSVSVEASLQSDLDEIQKKLQEIQKKKNSVQTEINNEKNKQNQYERELYRLKNEIDLLTIQIEEKQLTVEELRLKIQLLEEEIENSINEITSAENSIAELQKETDSRLIDMYISQKTNSSLDLFFSPYGTDIIKLDLYQTSIQQETNDMLTELNKKKEALAKQKAKLEEDKIQVQRDEVQIEEETIAMEKAKTDLDSQRAVYYRKRNESLAKIDQNSDTLNLLTQEEQMALAEQRRLEQIIFDSINAIPSGSYVTKGTVIGQQGCTGYCTGPHLHFAIKVNGSYQNPCSQLPAGYLPGCGISNSSLNFPMTGSYVLTSGYGWRWGSFHYGIDVANYNASAPIYATHNGYMFSGFEPCSGSICKNGGANYRIICENRTNCNQGLKTMYWHLR